MHLTMRTTSLRTAGLLAAMAATVIAVATPRAGADSLIFHGRDSAIVSTDRRSGTVCDREEDGHAVTGVFHFASFPDVFLVDSDGAAGGCSSTSFPAQVTRFEVCEARKSCNSGF
jgi:hypothetical protein